jgi:hypothetical protein
MRPRTVSTPIWRATSSTTGLGALPMVEMIVWVSISRPSVKITREAVALATRVCRCTSRPRSRSACSV